MLQRERGNFGPTAMFPSSMLSCKRALAILVASAAICVPAGAPAADYRPGQVVVRTQDGRTRVERVSGDVLAAAARIARRPGVKTATPNWIARASAFIPNDPGQTDQPAGWQLTQWNFLPEHGINMPQAWENLINLGHPGGSGVIVAVLDTGVAYRNRGRFLRSPDLDSSRFRKGFDFVDNDPYPLDHNGHGTHVASTINESVNNGIGLTGIAYGAKIIPVRVLDRLGEGDSVAISAGIKFAARKGAKIINLSFEFSSTVTRDQIPDIIDALTYARRKGALVIGASGNASAAAVAYPARARNVLSVGAITEHGCLASYSNSGPGLDIVAPGGGDDASLDEPQCAPDGEPGRNIIQLTYDGSVRRFGYPNDFMGTSMAAPHVSGVAALVVASGLLGPNPSPQQIESHLKRTARDLGKPGPDAQYGAGLLDAAAATTPPPPPESAPPPA